MPISKNTGKELEPKKGFEVATTPEFRTLMNSLSTLRAKIQGSESLGLDSLREIEEKAKDIHIQVEEKSISLADAKNDSNVKIWRDILNGDMSDDVRMTILPAFVVRGAPKKVLTWNLSRLTKLDQEVVEALIARSGTRIHLNIDTHISRSTAEILARPDCYIIDGIDIGSNYFGKHMSAAWAFLFSVCKEIQLFQRDSRAEFCNLEELTPEVVREFFYDKDNTDYKGWPELDFPALKSLDETTAQAMADNPKLPEIQLSSSTSFTSPRVAEILLKVPSVRTRVLWSSNSSPCCRSNNQGVLVISLDSGSYPAWLVQYHIAKCPDAKACFMKSESFPTYAHIEAVRPFTGILKLGCNTLKPEEAKLLSTVSASQLELNLQDEVSPKVITELARYPNKINFMNDTNNINHARILAARKRLLSKDPLLTP